MSEEKARGRRFVEEINKGKAEALAVIDEMFDPNIVVHTYTGEDIRGIKNYKKYTSAMFDAFPDYHATFDDRFVVGDKVATRVTWTGTHKGEYMGVPPTNKKVKMWALSINRMAGDKIVEMWLRMDTLGFMQQLGAVPTPKKKK